MARKPPKGKSLAEVNPELANQWHPTKNGDLTPFDFTSGSGEKVWWKCDKGDNHEWEALIYKRNKGAKCPLCPRPRRIPKPGRSFAEKNPDLITEWYTTKNKLSPYDYNYGSNELVWWKCGKGDDHIWESSIKSRNRGRGCHICSGKLVVKSTCLNTTHPEIAKEWHPTKNDDLNPDNISKGSDERVWWKCNKGDDHEWDSIVSSRVAGSNCPMCSGHRATQQTSLAFKNPKIAEMWHPTKNGNLTPVDITYHSGKKVWWECSNNHVFYESVFNVQRRKIKCIICNSLAVVNPDLAKEWHPTKNGDVTPSDISFSSGQEFWWKCDKGDDHEWQSSVDNRKERGCSVCAGLTVVKSNCLATTHPELAEEWHPTKNGDLTPLNIIAGSHSDIWWKCDAGENHEWVSRSSSRVDGNGCPYCAEYGFNRSKDALFYIRTINLENGKQALKFGITNNMDGDREKKQKRHVKGSVKTILREKVSGETALDIENLCKKHFGRKGYLTVQEFPDGFSETIKYSEESLNKIKSIVDKVLTEKAEKKK